MVVDFTAPRAPHRYAAIALTLLAHALLVLAWQHARRFPPADQDDGPRIQWVAVAAPAPKPIPVAPAPLALPPRHAASGSAPARPAPAQLSVPLSAPLALPAPPPVARATVPSEPAPQALAPEAPAPDAAEILRQARSSIGKIDRDLRRAHPGQPISAPLSNGTTRLAQGLQAAADAAPNRWYEAPKVTEIIDPGPYARRRYRVVGADRTYCITVESNHAPDGLDIARHGIGQKTTNCEANEQAATKQTW
jgi:hypothetical protein